MHAKFKSKFDFNMKLITITDDHSQNNSDN